ncbi:DUF1766-domain-containing protein [Coleophoma crateriformis]|uniref:DUF1766-domain-containing protein n=1 Tax=Coleophoma crateriformis TaxID=565419 RepID=A0A3D8RWM4_9HELO|nr:DUF1766-domain-containing protein [Coleophoma crateriformis]
MPFIPHTPESLMPRSDSKNPASTCKGLTASGRPCRRSLAKSPQSSPSTSPLRTPSPDGYCWQHQDQAQSAAPSPQGVQPSTLNERTSVDTLVDRLGILEIAQNGERKKRRRPSWPQYSEKPHALQETQRPLSQRPQQHSKPRPHSKTESNLGLFCCIGIADEENHGPRPVTNLNSGRRTSVSFPKPPNHRPSAASTGNSSHLSPVSGHASRRPHIRRDPSSRTAELLSLIPKTASPETTALLLAELAKPVSANDDEGFIYMFWLTPESLPSEPPSEAARSLLAPPSRPEPGRRRTSDVLDSFASFTSSRDLDSSGKKTILLKIGRAQNVQRRLNQWTRQCGYNLSLIRYYPYQSSTPTTDIPPATPRKLPHAHKVERLIHIELNAKRAKADEHGGKCVVCGREHREWFEVEASREGVKGVDEVIRRWVDWGERSQ